MAFGKIGQKLTAIEIFDLVRTDLDQVEREIGLESIASVERPYLHRTVSSVRGR
jgi:hypothetical protein